MIAISLPSSGNENESDGNRSKNRVSNLSNFWWDNIILTMITLLLAITFAQSITSYFRSGINCLIPENHTDSVRAYVNDICRQELPNYAKYFPLALYAEVVLMSGLQVFWKAACNGRIECFMTSVNTMSLKRSPMTGQYELSDIEMARYLGGKLHSISLTLTYICLKLGLQTVVAIAGLCLTVIEPLEYYNTTITFECENSSFSNSFQWPLSSSEIDCAYIELSTLQYLPWINYVACIIIMMSATTGLGLVLYFLCKRDYKVIANHMLRTGLKKHEYRRITLCNFNLPCSRTGVSMDLAFLVSQLYETNYKVGEAVFNLLIHCQLEYLTQDVHHYDKLPPSLTEDTVTTKIKDMINEALQLDNNQLKPCGILVTTSTDNLAYLMKEKDFEKLICINFNPDIIDEGAGIIETSYDHDNIMFRRVLQIPAHFWQKKQKTLTRNSTPGGDETANNDDTETLEQVLQHIIMSCIPRNGGPLVFIFAPQSEEYYTLDSAHHKVKRLMKYIHSDEMQQQLRNNNSGTYAITVKPIPFSDFDIQCRNCIQWCQQNKLDLGKPPWLSSRFIVALKPVGC